MAELTTPPSDPLAGATGRELRELQQFLLYLGSALTAAGEAVNQIEEHLRRVAAAYGAPRARVSVLPTYVVVALEPGRPATLEPTRQLRGGLRLDQTAALFDVLKAAERGEPPPDEGSRRIREIVGMKPRFGHVATILGHVVLTVGICLVLQPTWGDLALAALTMAVVELSAAEMITGASRLVAGALQLLLLGFGIIGAAQVVGLPSADALVDTPSNLLGWWAPWLGVLIVGIGTYLHFSAPPRSFGWLCLVLYAAWIGQYLGDQAFGGYLSGFVGAIVMTPVAYVVERQPSGPPALVSFLPAFWLLVPGALGLIGVTEYLGNNAVAGVQDFLGAVGSMVAIALGVLCGYPLYRAMARSLGWLRELGSGAD